MLNIKMVLDLTITDENSPLRVCRQCMKPFYETEGDEEFCTSKCEKRYLREHK